MNGRAFDGLAVRRMREARGWSRPELAARSLISASHLKHIEAPGAAWPKAITVAALTRALGCSVKALSAPVPAEVTSRVA